MDIVLVLLAIVAVGLIVWAVNRFAPLDANFKTIFNIVAIGGLVFWLLSVFGVLDLVNTIKIGNASLLLVLGVILLVGILVWVVETYVPLDSRVKSIFQIVAIIGLILWILSAVGILPPIGNIKIGK